MFMGEMRIVIMIVVQWMYTIFSLFIIMNYYSWFFSGVVATVVAMDAAIAVAHVASTWKYLPYSHCIN